jgi:uncharacterized membrane protein YcaP (DUF421 family)
VDIGSMLVASWSDVVRVLLVGTLAYVALVAILRISGKRTLGKFNAFDWVVTVALGSTLATVLLNKQVTLIEGVLALALLVGLQYAVASMSTRSGGFRNAISSEPRLLMHRGRFIDAAMADERVTRDEVLASLRAAGMAQPGPQTSVILETNGDVSVLEREDRHIEGVAAPTSVRPAAGAEQRDEL